MAKGYLLLTTHGVRANIIGIWGYSPDVKPLESDPKRQEPSDEKIAKPLEPCDNRTVGGALVSGENRARRDKGLVVASGIVVLAIACIGHFGSSAATPAGSLSSIRSDSINACLMDQTLHTEKLATGVISETNIEALLNSIAADGSVELQAEGAQIRVDTSQAALDRTLDNVGDTCKSLYPNAAIPAFDTSR
jgi:hypothetical protein